MGWLQKAYDTFKQIKNDKKEILRAADNIINPIYNNWHDDIITVAN